LRLLYDSVKQETRLVEIGEVTTLAVEGQRWNPIEVKLDGDDKTYYAFQNPNSNRYLTALINSYF